MLNIQLKNQICKHLFMSAAISHASHLYDHCMCAVRAAPHPPTPLNSNKKVRKTHN